MKAQTKKIAICGTHHDTLKEAPFNDETWEIWAPAHRLNKPEFPRISVGFEIHKESVIKNFIDDSYLEWLKEPTIPVYIRPDMKGDYPKCEAYPIKEATKIIGREYFASTFSFMIAKAILDGATEIGFYGINLTADEEYFYQRPNAEYLIGIARGKGIKITIPHKSALLSLGYTYGDGTPVGQEDPLIAHYEKRAGEYETEIKRLTHEYERVTEDFKKEVNQILGAQHEAYEIIKALKNKDRGGLRNNHDTEELQ